MTRTRRGRMLNLGILFLIYSVIRTYSVAETTTSVSIPLNANNGDSKIVPETTQTTTPSSLSTTTTTKTGTAPSSSTTTVKSLIEATLSTTTLIPGTNESTTTEINTNLTTKAPESERQTVKEKRKGCHPPAIEQFPPQPFDPDFRKRGGLIIHIVIAIFTFLGLAIVCDDYFVASLDRICEELRLSPDVAGATFMAAGSSAPELGTVIIGVFFAKDDIGVSGVIGSAVFNIMFVISVCALCTGTVCHLNWWPLVRDCFFYCVSIIIMLIVMANNYITWGEALVMLIFYVIYCVMLHFNSYLEKWAYSLKLPIKLPTKEEQSALVTFKNVPEIQPDTKSKLVDNKQQEQHQEQQQPTQPPTDQNYQGYNDVNDWDPNAAWGENAGPAAPTAPTAVSVSNYYGAYPPTTMATTDSWDPNASWDQGQQNYAYTAATGDQSDQTQFDNEQTASSQKVQVGKPPAPEYYKSKDPKTAEAITDPLVRPAEGGAIALITWRVCYPIHYLCKKTMPDCRTEKYRNWYGYTFVISMLWISFYSYFMVWMITIIGATLGIPDTVMGMTFVAAGVSIPDALSSIAVIKEGYGDMAVSNAVGSNVFDILVCLGLPWFIQTGILHPGLSVNVISKGLIYSTMSLLSTVVFLLLSIHLNGWKLDRRLGIILMVWYFIFITIASMYELNVFGNNHDEPCPSRY